MITATITDTKINSVVPKLNIIFPFVSKKIILYYFTKCVEEKNAGYNSFMEKTELLFSRRKSEKIMDNKIKEIIEKISFYDGTFPSEELETLIDNRAESTPYLLEAIRNAEEVLDKLINEDNYFLPFYALFMLAQFRETEAYPLVYRIFSADAERVDAAFDDFITEDLSRILASVSGGDVSLINKLIEDENVYEFVSAAALDSWLCLLRAGLKTREEVIAYYKILFEKPCEEVDFLRGSMLWNCLNLKAVELLPEIEKSYAENKIELLLMGNWNDFQKLMAEENSRFLDGSSKEFDLIDDMISDLEDWYCFSKPHDFMREGEDIEIDDDSEDEENILWNSRYEGTFVRETPKVGKNDPCPCGSGRKYKKCCMNLGI